LRLDSLDEASCRALLARRGIADESMAPILGLARGNPLALELAARYTTAPELGGLGENAVLDALVRLLRKKLGRHAADIETVKGRGFRIAQRNSLET
jgi:hypothetical protein